MLLGNVFQQASEAHRRGNLPEAERLYRQLIALAPQEDAARVMLAMLKQSQGLFDEALGLLDGARNKDAGFCARRGNILGALHRDEEAEAAYRRGLKLDPRSPDILFNRALLRFRAARHAEALADYDAGLAVAPGYADGHNNRGWCLLNLRRLPEAFAAFEAALAVNPNLAGARLNQGVWHLLQGNFAAGLPLYEFRKRLPQPVEARVYPQPLWTGREDIAGRHVFVYVEQGLGDAIQYVRFIDALLERGAQVTLAVPRLLLGLLASAQKPVRLIDLNTPPKPFDYHVPLMSLPLALGTRLETIPAPGHSLAADPVRVARWKALLGDGFRIGISWQGAAVPGASGKGIPLELFEQIADIPGLRLFSLHKADGQDDLPAWLNLLPGLDADAPFLDSAAVIASLDLVISADTVIAHLAGVLGAPLWLALKYVPDWRWQLDRVQTPWYRQAQLFRQPSPDDWESVFAAITQAVHEKRMTP